MTTTINWSQRIGNQRDWVWRGWQTRYCYLRNNFVGNTPLILIHGFGASIEHWRFNLPILSQYQTVYALDLLGFGASRKASVDYSINLWVEQVHDFWQTFIAQPVVLVGNSIGSLVCLTAAATYPEMVKGLVMLSLPDVSLRQAAIPRLLQPIVTGLENLVASPLLINTIFKFVRQPATIRRWAGVAYCDRSAIDDELVAILSNPAYDEGAAQTFYSLFQRIRRPQFAPAVTEILPQLTIPILLVWGRQDRMIPFALAAEIAPLNESLKLVALEQVGHCPHDECPEQFNQILLDWLNQHFSVAKQEVK
ncbi:MAG: alpha/beta fold hydrolase [Stanieria sp.]